MMKVPLEWLNEYVTIRLKAQTLAERLTMAGLEVTGIIPVNGEPVLNLEITPNRADCLSIIGVAREVAAITNQRLKLPKVRNSECGIRNKFRTPHSALRIQIEDRKGCRRYIGRLIEQVKIGPSPAWMQKRLLACGLRPINNAVDITNYVLLELGQPLHAFDFDRLAQGVIVVRRALSKESITTLDGVSRALSGEMLVIADASQPVAIAGVMGAMASQVTQHTTRLLLESALFDPLLIRRSARALGLTTESSYRFERGVDPTGVESASARAASLIRYLAGAKEGAVCDAGLRHCARTTLPLEPLRASRWLGISLSPGKIRTTLARLSCRASPLKAKGALRVWVPPFRRDLTQPVDLYEELARIIGYGQIPSAMPTGSLARALSDSSTRYLRLKSLRGLCVSLGLTETISWALVSEEELERCGLLKQDALRLANPLSLDYAYLRPSLLIGMLRSLRYNLAHGTSDARLFEIGSIVKPNRPSPQPTGPTEMNRLGIALSGLWSRDWRTKEPCDLLRLKGLIQALTERLCKACPRVEPAKTPWAESARGVQVKLNGKAVGMAGQVLRHITQALDIDQEVWFAELFIEELLACMRLDEPIQRPCNVPLAKRDLSVMVSEDIAFERIAQAIRDAAGPLASRIELIDRYMGRPVPDGSYSLTFSIEYRDPSRTLTADEVEAIHRKIGQVLIERFGAQPR